MWGEGVNRVARSGHGGSHVHVCVCRGVLVGWGGVSRVAIWGCGSGRGGSQVHKQLVIVCVRPAVLTYTNNC